MSRSVLLSVKPRYVAKILDGSKLYEFRRKVWKELDVDWVYIYSSAPVKCVVARFRPVFMRADCPVAVWSSCNAAAGINAVDFFRYCNGIKYVWAIEICDLEVLKEPVDLLSWLSQGFVYRHCVPMNFNYLPHWANSSWDCVVKGQQEAVQ